jgi:hypothetical protein
VSASRGHRYESIVVGKKRFADLFDDYLAFLEPRLVEAHRVLAPHGCLYVHLDYREVHYCKVLLDAIFDRACFLNEIIWAYDYGGRPRDRWPPKHDTILLYAKVPGQHVFNVDAIERIPYMAPGLVGPEKAGARETPNRYMVAHDCSNQRFGEDRVSDPEAAGHPPPDHPGIVSPWSSRARFFRRQRDDGDSGAGVGSAFHSGGQQPGSPSGDGPAIRWHHGDRVGRFRSDAMLCHSLIGRMHSCQVNPGRSGMFLARWNDARPAFCIPAHLCPSSAPTPFSPCGRRGVWRSDGWKRERARRGFPKKPAPVKLARASRPRFSPVQAGFAMESREARGERQRGAVGVRVTRRRASPWIAGGLWSLSHYSAYSPRRRALSRLAEGLWSLKK